MEIVRTQWVGVGNYVRVRTRGRGVGRKSLFSCVRTKWVVPEVSTSSSDKTQDKENMMTLRHHF